MSVYPGYRFAFCRRERSILLRTTKQTFLNVCPPDFIAKDDNGPTPYTELKNGSRIWWIGISDTDEHALRSLELNSALVDQAEDVSESVCLTLQGRIERWSAVDVPPELAAKLPKNRLTGKAIPPSYLILLANVPAEGEMSYLYRMFDNINTKKVIDEEKFSLIEGPSTALFESSTVLNVAISEQYAKTLQDESKGKEWVDRFVHAKRTQSSGSLHLVDTMSLLYDPSEEWYREFLSKAYIIRVLDHGASAPTCCLWGGYYKGVHIIFREYYAANLVISNHRSNIAALSQDCVAQINLADPAIFRPAGTSKFGQFLTVSDEYSDPEIDGEPINFNPADNNEMVTRDRINDYLKLKSENKHPITGESPAPSLYFIMNSVNYMHGCNQVVHQLKAQRKEKLGTFNGENVYSDNRDGGIADHAYDPLRYYVAHYADELGEPVKRIEPGSFGHVKRQFEIMKRKGLASGHSRRMAR